MPTYFKKADLVIRKSFRPRRYAILDVEESNYIMTPKKIVPKNKPEGGRFRKKKVAISDTSGSEKENIPEWTEKTSQRQQPQLKRGTSMTQSMRSAVVTLKQKLKLPTRRSQHQATPQRTSKRCQSLQSDDVQLYSPFKIDTPSGPINSRTLYTQETPTRLRREVESLTANMRTLSTLTPNTLQARCRSRKSSSLNSENLRVPRSARKRITVEA